MMRAYGPETMTAARASDILLQISNKGVTTFAQLAPNIGKVAGLAAQAGVSAEEMGAALATITGTASTDESITQLTALIGDIVRPMDGARKMAQELGLDFGAVALSTQGLGGIMARLRQTLGITVTKELAGMIAAGADTNVILDEMATKSGVQIQKLAELFPNVNSLRAALALMAGEGGAFSDNLDAMTKSTGATDSAFSKMAGTMAEDYKKAKAAVLDLQISIGQALGPALRLLGESLLPIVERVNAWIQNNPALSAQIADVAVQILAGAAALGAFGVAMSGISSAVGIATASIRILALSVSVV
jgi:TP901 family phage tail tape measure protein